MGKGKDKGPKMKKIDLAFLTPVDTDFRSLGEVRHIKSKEDEFHFLAADGTRYVKFDKWGLWKIRFEEQEVPENN